MNPNEAVIHEFYEAFARRDGAAMGALYHDEATFSDPVFQGLDADGARAMWAMLCEQAEDLRIEHSNVQADDTKGSAHWEAWYPFSLTGRKVHNVIEAEFEFRDGKIVRHVDTFDYYRWTKMALGPMGVLLGWTPLVQNKIRKTAAANLARYRRRA